MDFVSYKLFNFFWNLFSSKAIKIYCIVRCSSIITIHIQSYPMSQNWFKLIKIYYICSITYYREIVSWISTIKFMLIRMRMGWHWKFSPCYKCTFTTYNFAFTCQKTFEYTKVHLKCLIKFLEILVFVLFLHF